MFHLTKVEVLGLDEFNVTDRTAEVCRRLEFQIDFVDLVLAQDYGQKLSCDISPSKSLVLERRTSRFKWTVSR